MFLRPANKNSWYPNKIIRFLRLILQTFCILTILIVGTGCVSKGYTYQGNPLFGWMEASGEVRTTDPFPILKRYPSYHAIDFEFPVGGKFADGYYLAQKFGTENAKFGGRKHLGEDWNALTGGDSDFAAPVYSFGNGVVSEIADYGGGWGKVIRIVHQQNLPNGNFYHLETVYAHLHTIDVEPGQLVKKTEWIGTIGDAFGSYPAHLHLELRSKVGAPLGGGYGLNTDGFLPPTRWLMQYGPKEKSFSEETFQWIGEKNSTL